MNRLINIKQSLARESVNFDFLYRTIDGNLDVCKKIYENFEGILRGKKTPRWGVVELLKMVSDPIEKDII